MFVVAAVARRPTRRVPPLTPHGFASLLLLRPPADALAVASDLIERGMSARALCLDVLAPALRVVGERWERGTATIAQEHLATETVQVVMARLSGGLAKRPPVGRRVLLACTDTELHQVGLRMVGDFLEGDGWKVYYVGASTPSRDLALLADRVRPDAIGLSTTLITQLPIARAAISAVRAREPSAFIVVGGAAYEGDAELARSLGADAFAEDAARASALLRRRFAPERVAAHV